MLRLRRALACASLVACVAACDDGPTAPPPTEPGSAGSSSPPAAPEWFRDITPDSGVTFVHDAAPSEQRYLPEIVGAGVAMLDYDGDGDLDLYFVQGGGSVVGERRRRGNELWENQWQDSGRLVFIDVTERAGVADARYGMGAVAADLDTDGDTDLLVTNLGRDTLYRNDGDGTFSDVSDDAGLSEAAWSASATVADYNGDGRLDIFVTHYVEAPIEAHKVCTNVLDAVDYCSPTAYKGTRDTLLRNSGDLKFEDVTEAAGLAEARGAGLGVLASDLDGDGATDFFVANDQSANFLWHNLGDGRFEEQGLLSGSAYNAHGMAEASMGVTAADFDGDGDDDLFMTHLNAQTNTLYKNDGAGGFRDATDEVRLGSASLVYTGFGARWFDVDNDGDLDIFTANGAVITEPDQAGRSEFPYAQKNQLFLLEDNGRYRDVSGSTGGALGALAVSRGAAFGDLDNDGDVDVVVANAHGAPQILENVAASDRHWLGLRVLERTGRRVAIGARVGVENTGKTVWRRVARGGSYLSSNDPRVHFGLGARDQPVNVRVRWPDGSLEKYLDVPPDTYSTLQQGGGEAF